MLHARPGASGVQGRRPRLSRGLPHSRRRIRRRAGGRVRRALRRGRAVRQSLRARCAGRAGWAGAGIGARRSERRCALVRQDGRELRRARAPHGALHAARGQRGGRTAPPGGRGRGLRLRLSRLHGRRRGEPLEPHPQETVRGRRCPSRAQRTARRSPGHRDRAGGRQEGGRHARRRAACRRLGLLARVFAGRAAPGRARLLDGGQRR